MEKELKKIMGVIQNLNCKTKEQQIKINELEEENIIIMNKNKEQQIKIKKLEKENRIMIDFNKKLDLIINILNDDGFI